MVCLFWRWNGSRVPHVGRGPSTLKLRRDSLRSLRHDEVEFGSPSRSLRSKRRLAGAQEVEPWTSLSYVVGKLPTRFIWFEYSHQEGILGRYRRSSSARHEPQPPPHQGSACWRVASGYFPSDQLWGLTNNLLKFLALDVIDNIDASVDGIPSHIECLSLCVDQHDSLVE